MKKILLIMGLCVVAMGCESSPKSGSSPAPAPGQSLDEAISGAAGTITAKLTGGGKIAVVNFTSPSEGLSEYVIEELSGGLAKGQGMVVVDRKSLELIREELKFQLSGEVSDESAQRIGQMLGAEYIATGSLSDVGNSYRFRVKVLTVETAALVASPSSDVSKKDERLAFLMKDAPKGKAKSGGEYKIGDTGPGGGTVFFAEGGIYMECSGELGDTYWDEAVKTAEDYKGGGFTDWHLPTRTELDLMYKLKQKGLGGFSIPYHTYWSSSEFANHSAWSQRFSDGIQHAFPKNSHNSVWSVRAVRAF